MARMLKPIGAYSRRLITANLAQLSLVMRRKGMGAGQELDTKREGEFYRVFPKNRTLYQCREIGLVDYTITREVLA